jgi:hypothetical protein
MMGPNYKLAREMARKILRQHKITSVPTDLQIICERLGLEFVELDDPDESDGAVLEMEGGLRVAMLNNQRGHSKLSVPDSRCGCRQRSPPCFFWDSQR